MQSETRTNKLRRRICRLMIKEGTAGGTEILAQIGYRLGILEPLDLEEWGCLSNKKFKVGMRAIRDHLEGTTAAPGKLLRKPIMRRGDDD